MSGRRKKPKRRVVTNAATELYPGHAADLQRQAKRHAKLAEVAANPFPGPLAEAFAAGPVKVGPYVIREFVPMDAAILRRLNSPFYRQILEILKPREQRKVTNYEDSDEWAVIYLFTRPCAEAEQKLNEGHAAYSQAAREAFAYNPRISLGLYQELFEGCAARIINAFHTTLVYQSARPDDGTTVFTAPPAQTTGSAGGSNTSRT